MVITKQFQQDNSTIKRIFKNKHIIKNNIIKITTIKDMKQLSKILKGKCQSNKYVNAYEKLKWECSEGHEWEATPNKIINDNQWCSKCRKKHSSDYRKPTIKSINIIAKKLGGVLISKTYKNIDAPLEWECSEGHKFKANLWAVKKLNRWCQECNIYSKENIVRKLIEHYTGNKFPKQKPKWLINKNGALLELDGYNKQMKLAFEYNGKQHYVYDPVFFHKEQQVFNAQEQRDLTKIKKCHEQNINLIIIPYTISVKQLPRYILQELKNYKINIITEILTEYFLQSVSIPKGHTFKELCELLNYKILEPYKGNRTKILMECNKGHTWNVQPRCILQGNRCPHCGNRIKYNIEGIRKKAKTNNLNLLSKKYIKNIKPLKVECAKCKKIFNITATNIYKNKTCGCQK